jgi:hypothetical protein
MTNRKNRKIMLGKIGQRGNMTGVVPVLYISAAVMFTG